MTAFLDTNIIIRYLTGDPPHLARAASAIIDGDETLLVSDVVLAEAGHVLGSVYGASRTEIVDSLTAFVLKDNVTTMGLTKADAVDAFLLCRPSRRTSFPDAILWAVARSSSTPVVYSLDARFPSEGVEVRRARPAS